RIRQPPAAVPAAIVAAHKIITHFGTMNCGVCRKSNTGGRFLNAPLCVPVKSASAMTPIVFCASFVPWLCAIQVALTNCNLPKVDWMKCGEKDRSKSSSNAIRIPPRRKPAIGELNIGTMTFGTRPVFHFKTDQSLPGVASAAPHRPPMSAWLELEGKPSHHVSKFQMIAPSSAHSTVFMLIALESTMPFPIVDATAVPISAPVRLKNAAIAIACLG